MKKFIKEYWIPILIGGTCTPMIRYAEKSYGEENKWFLWLGFCLLILLYIIFSERAKAKKKQVMKKLILLLFIPIVAFGQNDKNIAVYESEINKYMAKAFIVDNILEAKQDSYSKFQITLLGIDRKKELSTMFFETKNVGVIYNGIIFGFYGKFDAPFTYNGYAYKYLSIDDSFKMINKIDYIIKSDSKFFKDDNNGNNAFFEFDDIKIIVYFENNTVPAGVRIRLLWNGYDSEWLGTSFYRTKKFLEEKYGKLFPVESF